MDRDLRTVPPANTTESHVQATRELPGASWSGRTGDARLRASTGPAYGAQLGAPTLSSGFARRVLEYPWRKVNEALERRRMHQLRRDPTALTIALMSARSILIVCHGNIIRSAFAARLIAQALGNQARVSIASAGLEALPGRPPHLTAVVTAGMFRVDLHDHAAASLSPEGVAAADVIFVMEVRHLVAMRRRFPEARAKTFLLTCLAPAVPLDIRDPIEGDERLFARCFDHIVRAVRPIVGILCGTPQRMGRGSPSPRVATERSWH